MDYVLKDVEGNYVGDNSIIYEKKSNKFWYLYSERLVNGFCRYPNEQLAKISLNKLNDIAKNIGFHMKFHIQRINVDEIITYENTLQFKKHPITYKEITLKENIA